jgi:aryl-alcohol dehydrogenase-like predicted oxidoreductase
MLRELAGKPEFDPGLREKLGGLDDGAFADLVLNTILRDTGIHVVIPAMMRVEHIRANVQAITQSRFNSVEIAQIREAFASSSQGVCAL